TRRLGDDDRIEAKAKLPHVAIIGGGISGIAMGVYLKKAGIPFVIYEKNHGPGGSWYDNRYPGCGVDTTTHLYSYSFALNPSWTRYFSKQDELMDYIESCIDRFDLREHISFDTTVLSAVYDGRWRLSMTIGGETVEREADVVVSGVGQLNVPSLP